ncbi:MAG: sulfatase [Candidatus Binatia bacterium]|nr:sulfatase [Candidatus Binatia bacterium]
MLAAAFWLVACVRAEEPAPAVRSSVKPNLLLITVDTLRADHLSAYGYRLPTSPNLDRLAGEGVRFSDATVPWPKTWPAVASMLTGKYPATTGVRMYPRRPLPQDHETLAELLSRAGYETAAVVANVNVSSKFGFDQGFDTFVESWEAGLEAATGSTTFANDPGEVKEFTGARVVTDQALELLDDLAAAEPFFLWLHYIDPHGPYRPPPEYDGLWADEYEVKDVPFEAMPLYQRQYDEAGAPITNISHYIAQYDREIRFFDDQLQRLLDELAARGLRDDTLLVLTSDHGESLDDDLYLLEHGAAPYQPTAGVPFVLVFPGRIPPGRVVEAPVGLIDLLPTLAAMLDLPSLPAVQGRSLVATWADSPTAPNDYVFLESGAYEPSQLSVRKGKWKLARLRAPRDRQMFDRREFELYDIKADPGEENDLADSHPALVAELQTALNDWRSDTPPYAGPENAEMKEVDSRTQALLRALGYVND